METGRDDRQQDRPVVQALRRVWRRLPLPVRRLGWRVLQRLGLHAALLSARGGHPTHGESVAPAPPVDPALVDRLAKDQTALAYRLLSIEEELARWRSVKLRGAEEAPVRHLPAGHHRSAAPEPATVAFDDVGLRLTTGPYGRFLVMASDLIGSALEHGEFWYPHLKPIIERWSDHGRVGIDVGADIGFHTVFMAHHFGRIHAFEPEARRFHLLNANVELNGCNTVSTYNLSLHDAEFAMELAGGTFQGGPSGLQGGSIGYFDVGNPTDCKISPMRSATIDSLQLRDVGFIKVNAHGWVLRVLLGARRTIAAERPAIVFEFEENLASPHGDSQKGVQDFFTEYGYDLMEVARSGPHWWSFLATPK